MNILILCGVFAEENEKEVVENAKSYVEFSANIFQKKLIGGFSALDCKLSVISEPFLGAYPFRSRIFSFRGFKEKQNKYNYVNFNNVWGIRNFSRFTSLKKALESFISDSDNEKLIVVYSAHTPFLQAAVYAKSKDNNIKICLYCPDLPEYMNLDSNRRKFYDFAKKYDIAFMLRLMNSVDSFVILTEHMKRSLPIKNKPYIVVEGIISEISQIDYDLDFVPCSLKKIVYTGKMNEKFGIKNLVKAFSLLKDENYRLILCGTGDCSDYLLQCSQKDSRIIYTGQVTPCEAKKIQMQADVLVNPRENNEEYTKYSFPSKNIEYLLTGKPVVAYKLDGMPEIYRDFIYIIDDRKVPESAIANSVENAIKSELSLRKEKYQNFIEYAKHNLDAYKISESIVRMNF